MNLLWQVAKALRVIGLMACCAPLLVAAQTTISSPKALMCPDAKVLTNIHKQVCWSAMFPIRIMGVTMGGGSKPDGSASRAFCACGGDITRGRLPTVGFSVGLYLPLRMVEVVRKPYCFPSLQGLELTNNNVVAGGSRAMGGSFSIQDGPYKTETGFYNFHYLAYPLVALMNLFDAPACNVGGFTNPDVMFIGEALPNWYNDELGAMLSPENILFANPLAMAAAPIDCAALSTATTGTNFSDSLYWAAGCWGGMYPLTGTAANQSLSRTTSLLATRAIFLLSRIGLVKRTIGNDALCEAQVMPIMRKAQYKMQMLFPVPESRSAINMATAPQVATTPQTPEIDPSAFNTSSRACSHPIGKNTMQWGEWRARPATGEDAVYLLFQWVDCCIGKVPGL